MKKNKFFIKNINLQQSKRSLLNSFFLSQRLKISKLFIEQIANNLAAWLLDSASSKWTFDRWITLTIPAKMASLLPPVGPFLGQHGFNTMNFCNTFNTLTKNYPEGLPIKVIIKLFTDKTILFQLKTPPTSFLLFSAMSTNDGISLKIKDLLKIIFIKKIDLNELSVNSLLLSIIGTLRSMKLRLN